MARSQSLPCGDIVEINVIIKDLKDAGVVSLYLPTRLFLLSSAEDRSY